MRKERTAEPVVVTRLVNITDSLIKLTKAYHDHKISDYTYRYLKEKYYM